MTYETEQDLRAEILALGEIIKGMAGHDLKNLTGFTPSQSRIIRVMQNAEGRTLTKHALMDAIYACAADEPDIKIIDVFIHKIRVRLRRPDQPLRGRIETIWGVGYRWVPEAMA